MEDKDLYSYISKIIEDLVLPEEDLVIFFFSLNYV